MRNVTYTTTILLEEKLTCNFQYENCRVTTVPDLKSLGLETVEDGVIGYFIISINTSIKDFESVSDAAAHARPMFLIVLDILSLFLDRPMTPFDTGFQTSFITPDEKQSEIKPILVLDGDDLSNDLKKFLETLKSVDSNRQKLFYSLMDRWRKATYMQTTSEESQEYDDEAVIAYFHVLELLAAESTDELSEKIKIQIEQSLNSIYEELMHFEGNHLSALIAPKKSLNNQLILSDLPVAGKILYALGKLGIMSKRLKYFLGNWIKDRNSVAHGRRVYQDKVIFPVPPFFPNARLFGFTLDTLRTLTAHVICTLAGIEIYMEKWEEEHNALIPTPEEVNSFIKDEIYKGLDNKQFVNGEVHNINPGSIGWYLVDKKIKPKAGLSTLNNFFMQIDLEDPSQVSQAIVAAVILSDTANKDVKDKCEQIILEAYKRRWHPFLNMRELLSFLEYNGQSPKFLEDMIVAKKVR